MYYASQPNRYSVLSQSTADIYIPPINSPQCVGPNTAQPPTMPYNTSLAPHTMSNIAYATDKSPTE